MARATYRLQAIREQDSHAVALARLFGAARVDRAYMGVAFARLAGVNLVAGVLGALAGRAKVFVGIRNDITSAQALFRLRQLRVDLYVVDTGRASEIFHPKVYAAIRGEAATILVGSANLTAGGLEGNIEASTALDLDLRDADDRAYVEDLEDVFEHLRTAYPDNVIRIRRTRQIAELLREGRIADESVRPLATNTADPAGAGRGDRESVPRMELARRTKVPRARPQRPPRLAIRRRRVGFILVWESDELSERDLNIPRGEATNPTGSMTLRKGRMEGIDHRHYFRDEVFRGLTWIADTAPQTRHLETTTAKFDVVIKGVNYGFHTLEIRHDTRTDSRSYEQRNAMTHLRWGDLRPLVARRDLLGSTARIYRREGNPPLFGLEIV